jgi:hypothetical protein
MYVAPRRAIRKAWQSNASVRAPVSGTVSSGGLAWHGPFVEGRFPWSALFGYRAKPTLMLIYTSNRQAVWLFDRFFSSPADWATAQTVIREHLRARAESAGA